MSNNLYTIARLLKQNNITPTEIEISYDSGNAFPKIPEVLKNFLIEENFIYDNIEPEYSNSYYKSSLLTIKNNFNKLEDLFKLPIVILKISAVLILNLNKQVKIKIFSTTTDKFIINFMPSSNFSYYVYPLEVYVNKESLLTKILAYTEKHLKKQDEIDIYTENIKNYLETNFKTFITGDEAIRLGNKARLYFYVGINHPLIGSPIELAFKKDKLMGVNLNTWGAKNIEKFVENIFK